MVYFINIKNNRYDYNYHNIIMSTADPVKFYNEIDYKNKLIIPDDIKDLVNKENIL